MPSNQFWASRRIAPGGRPTSRSCRPQQPAASARWSRSARTDNAWWPSLCGYCIPASWTIDFGWGPWSCGAWGPPPVGPAGPLWNGGCSSYVNSYFANGAVIVPAYGYDRDAQAVATYRRLFPEKWGFVALLTIFAPHEVVVAGVVGGIALGSLIVCGQNPSNSGNEPEWPAAAESRLETGFDTRQSNSPPRKAPPDLAGVLDAMRSGTHDLFRATSRRRSR